MAVLVLGATPLRAQVGGTPDPTAAAAVANPFANPYMNPFMNPYATMQPMDRSAMLLYLLKSRDATGAIGSGQLNGSRPAPGGAKVDGKRRAAEMPRTSMTPGGGASRYFRRAPETAQGRAAYFERQNRYFGNNGR
jgi:hypothetical protein